MTEHVVQNSRIRPMHYADLERVLAWRNHPAVRRYMYTQTEITLAEHQSWFERTRQDARKHLLIFEADDQPLGFMSLGEVVTGGVADWGFYAAPEAPKGSGRQLVTAALNHAFVELRLHKICGQVLSYNDRSIRLHRSLGFQQEGALRDQHFDGESYHEVICFGLLSGEWKPNP